MQDDNKDTRPENADRRVFMQMAAGVVAGAGAFGGPQESLLHKHPRCSLVVAKTRSPTSSSCLPTISAMVSWVATVAAFCAAHPRRTLIFSPPRDSGS